MALLSPLTEIQTLPCLIGKNRAELEALVASMGEPKFRAEQLHQWLYVKCVRDFDAMTNLAKGFRDKLKQSFQVGCLTLAEKQVSDDGTIKYLFRLPDGAFVESVLMHYTERDTHSVCLSTQVGCAVNCHFCATGKMGFKRQMSVTEIVEQYLFVQHDSGEEVRNIVFMGQGEPLLNMDNLVPALHVLNQSAEVGMRRITVSTSGIVPKIEQLASEDLPLTLAVSLHAPNNEVRSSIMPINDKWPVETLIDTLVDYHRKTRRRITIEYVLLAGVNDAPEHAHELGKLLHPLKCNVNLIPYNPIGEAYGFQRPSRDAVEKFLRITMSYGKKTTVRLERGADIAAACGQLANSKTSD